MTVLPSVGVVLVNFNGKDDTLRCLESLRKSTYQRILVFLIENSSPDPSKSMTESSVSGFRNVFLERTTLNLGFAGGMNRGIGRARDSGCKYALVLNNDTCVDEKCIDHLVSAAEMNPNAACVSPLILDIEKKDAVHYAGGRTSLLLPFHRYSVAKPSSLNDRAYETELCSGAAMLLRIDSISNVGGFDERLFFQCEDTDLSLRLRKAGFALLVSPNALIWHKIGASMGERMSPVSVFFWARNSLIVTRKNATSPKREIGLFLFGACFIPLFSLALLLTGRPHLVRPLILGVLWNAGFRKNFADDVHVRLLSGRRHPRRQ